MLYYYDIMSLLAAMQAQIVALSTNANNNNNNRNNTNRNTSSRRTNNNSTAQQHRNNNNPTLSYQQSATNCHLSTSTNSPMAAKPFRPIKLSQHVQLEPRKMQPRTHKRWMTNSPTTHTKPTAHQQPCTHRRPFK